MMLKYMVVLVLVDIYQTQFTISFTKKAFTMSFTSKKIISIETCFTKL